MRVVIRSESCRARYRRKLSPAVVPEFEKHEQKGKQWTPEVSVTGVLVSARIEARVAQLPRTQK